MKKQLITTLMALFTMGAGAQNMLPYQNPNLSAEERADDLISRLTIEEKTALMMDQSPAIERLGIPSFQWWNEALHGVARTGHTPAFSITLSVTKLIYHCVPNYDGYVCFL